MLYISNRMFRKLYIVLISHDRVQVENLVKTGAERAIAVSKRTICASLTRALCRRSPRANESQPKLWQRTRPPSFQRRIRARGYHDINWGHVENPMVYVCSGSSGCKVRYSRAETFARHLKTSNCRGAWKQMLASEYEELVRAEGPQ